VEEMVHPASVAAERRVADLPLPAECILAAVIREGRLIIPHGDTVLHPSDEVLAVVHSSRMAELASILGEQGT